MRNPRRACRDRPQHDSAVRRLQAGLVIEDTDRNTIHVAPPLNPKNMTARRSGPSLFSPNRVTAGLITCWYRPWRDWPAIPGIRDIADRGPAGQVRWALAAQRQMPAARPRPPAAAYCRRPIPPPP